MGLFRNLKRYRDERDEMIRLRHAIDQADETFRTEVAGLKPRDEEYQHHLGNLFAELDDANASIAELETTKMQRRAAYWRVPLPERPRKEGEAHEFWSWHDIHGRYYISDKGLSQLRREIYQEWEMWWKPWLTWAALAISIISLAVAALKS